MSESRLGLKAMVAAAKPGECAFCGEPAKKRSMSKRAVEMRQQSGAGDYQMTCGEPECARDAYTTYYKRDRAADAKARKLARRQHLSVVFGTQVSS